MAFWISINLLRFYISDTEIQHSWYTGKEHVELRVKCLWQELSADQSSKEQLLFSAFFNVWTQISVWIQSLKKIYSALKYKCDLQKDQRHICIKFSWQITSATTIQNKWMNADALQLHSNQRNTSWTTLHCGMAKRSRSCCDTEPKLRSVSYSKAERPCISWVLAQTTPQLLDFARNKAVPGQPLVLTFLWQF